jgi:hypothetical protein
MTIHRPSHRWEDVVLALLVLLVTLIAASFVV